MKYSAKSVCLTKCILCLQIIVYFQFTEQSKENRGKDYIPDNLISDGNILYLFSCHN